MIEIIPAILPKSFEDLKSKMDKVSGFAPMVQVDVCDGVFVPAKTWPYIKRPDPDFGKILKEEESFPFFEELDFEADLMVSNPEEAAKEWIAAGAKRLIVHIESTPDPKGVILKIKNSLPSEGSFLYTEVGAAVNPDTSDEKLEAVLDVVDFVQFMGIEKIGFQGQPFDTRVLEKISRLRAARPNVTISVDGGVNLDTAERLIEAGATRLAVGSAIFESENIPVAIENFFELDKNE